MNELTLNGAYKDEPLTINVSNPIANITVVTIVLGYQSLRYSKKEHAKEATKRIMGGIAVCHPKDKFDILLGAKIACRNALEIGVWPWAEQRNREIYSACRMLIAQQRTFEYVHSLKEG